MGSKNASLLFPKKYPLPSIPGLSFDTLTSTVSKYLDVIIDFKLTEIASTDLHNLVAFKHKPVSFCDNMRKMVYYARNMLHGRLLTNREFSVVLCTTLNLHQFTLHFLLLSWRLCYIKVLCFSHDKEGFLTFSNIWKIFFFLDHLQ